MNEYTITKKVAKQGDNGIIILPKVLQIKPNSLVELKIKVLKGE